MTTRVVVIVGLLGLFGSVGCATNFTGDPHVGNGRAGCEAKCQGQGMSLAGMVYMGEYTDGCVCAVPGHTAERDQLLAAAASTSAGAAGVVMQMRRAQAAQQNSMSMY